MRQNSRKRAIPRLYLDAETAADLMTPNPVSLRDSATVRDAIIILAENQLRAAPVIDDAGRPVGVLSQADLVGRVGYAVARPSTDLNVTRENGREVRCDEPDIASTGVRDIMTSPVIAVAPEAAVDEVVRQMLDRRVHRLYVVGGDGALTGVIGFVDVLRHLQPARRSPARTGPAGKRKEA